MTEDRIDKEVVELVIYSVCLCIYTRSIAVDSIKGPKVRQ